MSDTMSTVLSPAVREAAERALPASMILAQEAVHTPEVQNMIKQLAKYNLAVSMPHMHQTGDFQEQPAGIVQVEVKSEFHTVSDAEEMQVLPVTWRWHHDRVIVSGSCHVNQRKCDG